MSSHKHSATDKTTAAAAFLSANQQVGWQPLSASPRYHHWDAGAQYHSNHQAPPSTSCRRTSCSSTTPREKRLITHSTAPGHCLTGVMTDSLIKCSRQLRWDACDSHAANRPLWTIQIRTKPSSIIKKLFNQRCCSVSLCWAQQHSC